MDEDKIPVLNELIFPGKPDKIRESKQKPEPSVKELLADEEYQPEAVKRPEPKQGSLHAQIEKIVDDVLQEHISTMRTEIAHQVIEELKIRFGNNKRK